MRANSTHGYGPYTQGCRCAVCRQAKADYMRGRRAASFLETRPVVPGIKHGLYGYCERGCRCDVCDKAQYSNRRRAAVAA